MTPAEHRADLLAALAEAEAVRDGADRTIDTLRRVLATTAATTPVLREPERPEWLPIGRAAQVLGVEKSTLAQRAGRGAQAGLSGKRGGRWYGRLDRMTQASGRPTR